MATLSREKSFIESFIDSNSLRSIFGGNKKEREKSNPQLERSSSVTRKWIKELSSLANVVVGRCARILMLQPEELQEHFEEEAPVAQKHPSRYARNFLEYCCFRALSVATQVTDHLHDKEFHRLVFDMMLAWEAPGATNKPVVKNEQGDGESTEEDDEDSALFYSDLMPMLVDVESTVGPDAFARLAPAIPLVADTISVYCQFNALTANMGGRLPYPVFEKYLGELNKSIKTIKGQVTPSLMSALKLSQGEAVIEIDGTATTQPVLQHVGVSTWPGRLTLTDQSLYFEAAGVVSYDKAKKFDLSADLRHVVRPDLTGPWGARLFDKAVMYKSTATVEPIVLEFPELTGRTRRDYWLAIIREVVAVNQFIRNYRLEDVGRAEALAKAVLGIARLRATREVFHVLPSNPESLLTFSSADKMPAGDLVLRALADQLHLTGSGGMKGLGLLSFGKLESHRIYSNTALAALGSLSPKGMKVEKEDSIAVGEILIGEFTALEKAVLQSRDNSKKVELAKSTIDGVKMDGIGTNIAVMKELLVPFSTFCTWISSLVAWQEPAQSATFLVVVGYIIYRNWVQYCVPLVLLAIAGYMVRLRHTGKSKEFSVVVVTSPPGQNAVEQLLALQQALSQLEGLLQAANIWLLKCRALFYSVLPEAHNQASLQVAALLVGTSFSLMVFNFRTIILIIFFDTFTRNMELRQESTARVIRRIKEWWYQVPAVNVRFIPPDRESPQQ